MTTPFSIHEVQPSEGLERGRWQTTPAAASSPRGSVFLLERAGAGVSWPLTALVWGMFFAGLLMSIGGVTQLAPEDLAPLAVILAFVILAERLDVVLYGEAATSVSMAGLVAAVVLFGFPGAVAVAAAGAVAGDALRNRPPHALLFNFGFLVVAAAATGLVFTASATPFSERNAGLLVGPALLASLTNYLLDTFFVSLAIALRNRTPVLNVWREKFRWVFLHHLMLGLLGLAVALAYEPLGLLGMAVFLAPPLMLRYGMKQYVDRTTETIQELRQVNTSLRVANDEIRQMSEGLAATYHQTLEALMAALDARDSETHGHSARVTRYALEIARELGWREGSESWTHLLRGALLHDVGKIGVGDTILHKPGSLSTEEWQMMRTHPQVGFDLLSQVSFLRPAAEIVLCHHERYDGTGYPRGLKGEEIPAGARIFAVVDAFDAITSARPYRAARSPRQAYDEILRHSGTQFDPEVVEAFSRTYPRLLTLFDEAGAEKAKAA